MKPLILISNDDGIDAPSLHALADAIESNARTDVLVVAPERQRSAASHAITLHKPLRLKKHAPRRFSLSGTPVDCVYVGMHKLAERRPTLVLSGINVGFNMGADVFYSGTVAAAREGALRGIRSVAFSIEHARHRDLQAGVQFCKALIEQILFSDVPGVSAGSLLNVNLPAITDTRFAWTRLGRREYADDVQERLDPRGHPYYWIGGGGIVDAEHEPGTDCFALASGIVSITPLSLHATDETRLAACAQAEIDGCQRLASATAVVNATGETT